MFNIGSDTIKHKGLSMTPKQCKTSTNAKTCPHCGEYVIKPTKKEASLCNG